MALTKKEKYILNVLRQGTIAFYERNECFKKQQFKVREGNTKDGRPKFKLHWYCAKCNAKSRNREDFEADHIIEIGSFTGDWNVLIERMFCDQDNWQLLCLKCHKKKSAVGNATRRLVRKDLEPDL